MADKAKEVLIHEGFFFYIQSLKTIFHYDEVFVSAQKKESGELSILLREFGLPSHLAQWMEYYAYHLEHPELNQLDLSHDLNVGHSTIQRALAFMKQELFLGLF